MNQLKIWFLASEVSPFAKTGGLGDVTGSLPKNLKLKNHEIRVIMPKYKIINERKYILREVIRLKNIPVTLNGETKTINVKSAFLPDSKVQIYFIENTELFGRSDLYTDGQSGKDYEDNAQRFAYFCKGALETLKILSWRPDIIHCNDWQTALIPYYLKSVYKDDDFLSGLNTIFTIHNLAYQGIFKPETAKLLDIDGDLKEKDHPFGFYGNLNLMKGAIHYSDWITTVSESYGKQITSDPEYGYGLENDLKAKKSRFSGIVNGVDYSVWSPENDKLIPFRYSADEIENKEQNKQALLTRTNLPYNAGVPVFGIIARLIQQKGFDLILEILDQLMTTDLQLVILGTGDKKIEKELLAAQKKYPGKISLTQAFDETLAHMIEAGSDLYLMPSAFEPCGMNQLYSLKYGTIPIVFKTGGLADTISEFDEAKGSGNGFVFEKYTGKELLKTIKRALKYYKKKAAWRDFQTRVMQEDFSWEVAVDKYLDVYATVLGE